MNPRMQIYNIKEIAADYEGLSKDLVLADIFTRWSSEFITKGLIELSESYPGLFELEANSS